MDASEPPAQSGQSRLGLPWRWAKGQLKLLCDDYPMHPIDAATRRRHLEVVGLYVVVCGVLIFTRFFSSMVPIHDVMGPDFGKRPDAAYWAKHWWIASVIIAYTVPTLLYCRLIMKLSWADLGLSFRGFWKHFPMYFLIFLAVLPFVLAVAFTEPFLHKYPLNRQASLSLGLFVLWELVYAFQFFCLELLFRGVMIFAPAKVLGAWSIVIMTIPYTMIHFRKPLLECCGAVVAGLVLGVIAMRTRSIWGGVMVHILVAWTMDFIAMFRKGIFAQW